MSKSDIFFHLMKNNQWDDFEDFAAFNYFNRGYSVFNSALILLQKPGATIVKTESRWNQEKRFIKPEATPLVILQPNGPVMLVYDYSDTYGEKDNIKNLAEELKQTFKNRTKSEISDKTFYSIRERLNRMGILYEEKPFGERQGGLIASLECPLKTYYIKRNRKHQYEEVSVDAYFKLVVNSSYTPHQKSLVIFHELGHLYCGHIDGGKKTEQNKIPEYHGKYISHDIKEYEAQMVCKIICEQFDFVDDESEQYLKQHMVNGIMPDYSKTDVISASDRIIKLLALK